MKLKPRRRRQLRLSLECLESRLNLSTFAEPVSLLSVGGVLDVTLRAHESSQVIEVGNPSNPTAPGVPTLVDGFLTYAWTVHTGIASNGQTTGDGSIGPTLRVNPGDVLRIRLVNDLEDVTPVTQAGGDQPTNLHTHGLIISPAGNSDNVLLNVPAGYTNDYEFQIPLDQEPGVNWYHPHRHGFVADQVYRGLMGFLVVGSADNDIDQVRNLPTRLMVIQAQTIVNDPSTGRPTLAPLGTSASGALQLTVNGQYMPELQMEAETEVWVGLQIDPRDLVRTFIPDPSVPPSQWNMDAPSNQPTFYVAQDGSAFPMTVEKARVALAPGKRVSEVVAAPPGGQERTFVGAAITPTAVPVPYYQPLIKIKGFGQGGDPAAWQNLPLTSPTMQYENLSL
ncbi:MAG: multicopper oxidase domain-containing protein, partial [Isosphaeraceae bacterium]